MQIRKGRFPRGLMPRLSWVPVKHVAMASSFVHCASPPPPRRLQVRPYPMSASRTLSPSIILSQGFLELSEVNKRYTMEVF
ncbi:hypothetical protein M404DRAFT_610871 [Pisolithus tinctorius Marx 270]|uniref:Uncharacterized protein n=1 Tax=Pisolithus tinctorius Marx 270 TaxID=870435 RepID=A0A0C3P803_PISTI|nr:hypothetical protein M404DRAFT_610871 [Pisolithus tinctorius Marx 270]